MILSLNVPFWSPLNAAAMIVAAVVTLVALVMKLHRQQSPLLNRGNLIRLAFACGGCLIGAAPFVVHQILQDDPVVTSSAGEGAQEFLPPALIGASTSKRLARGETFPEVPVENWLGPVEVVPPGTATVLTVVDIWAQWCPVVNETAPNLIGIYEKYHKNGVRFVSLTPSDKSTTEQFCSRHKIPWATGMRLDLQSAVHLGVYFPGMPLGNEAVMPTLYVIDQNGIVLWCDDSARMEHKEPAETARMLDEAIARELKHLQSPSKSGTMKSATDAS